MCLKYLLEFFIKGERRMEEKLSFKVFGLHDAIMRALEEAQFEIPSLIQQEVIPLILEGRDLIGQAQTGTGKTGAFGLPSLHLLHKNPESQVLVLTPTRELAKQVSDELYRFGKYLGIKSSTVCGGKSSRGQIEALEKKGQVIVATPGRLLDLLGSNSLPNFQPSIVILDEADEMLDMGFLEDITSIFQYLPKKRQTLMFSATMPLPIKKLAEKILNQPLSVSIKQQEKVNQDIEQCYYMIREEERDHAIMRMIDYDNPEKAIIFCRTKKDVDRLTATLLDAGYSARGLHGDMEQTQREDVIRNFRLDHLQLLVATDVAARGLNVTNISHVFNYHLPFDPTSYVHRIGRTGRAGRKGVASTFLTSREWNNFQRFEKILGTKIHRKNIPTLSQVKLSKRHLLVNKILSHGIHEDSENFLQLMKDVDARTIASKLISMLLNQQMLMGPDEIGFELQEKKVHRERDNRSRERDRPYPSQERKKYPGKSFKKFGKAKAAIKK